MEERRPNAERTSSPSTGCPPMVICFTEPEFVHAASPTQVDGSPEKSASGAFSWMAFRNSSALNEAVVW